MPVISLNQLRTHGVYIFVPTMPQHPKTMDFACECIVSGLNCLEVPVFSNVEALGVTQRELGLIGHYLYVFNVREETYSELLMGGVEAFASPHKLILSMADTNGILLTPSSVPSLMTHENKFRKIPGNRLPWAFGLSARKMDITAPEVPFEERKNTVIRNFRASRNQQVRNVLDLAFVSHLENHFTIDRRVGDDHFERLKNSVGCLAYGGSFDENLVSNPYFANLPRYQKLYANVIYHQSPVILRWDSWRWWESLASGCLTFHLDFEKYGFLLPVMPRAWEDYIPIDLADPKGTVDKLMDQRSRWAEIAANGRSWARTHYSPKAVAQRLIDMATGGD